jgi:hypothetical protein
MISYAGVDVDAFMSTFIPVTLVLCSIGFVISGYLLWSKERNEKIELASKLLQVTATKKGE